MTEEEYISLLQRNLGDDLNSHFLELQIGRSYRDKPAFSNVIAQLKQRNFVNVTSQLDDFIINQIELEDSLRFRAEIYAIFYFFEESMSTFERVLAIKKDDKQALFILNLLHFIIEGHYDKNLFNRLLIVDSTLAAL